MEEKYELVYDNIAVLFYRGNDKNRETKICGYDEYVHYGNELLKRNPDLRFLIQSDETEFIELMTATFPNSFYFKDEIRHMQKCNDTVDLRMRSLNSEFSKKYLAITVIMSKCAYIVCGSGNCSIWVMFYRGHSDNVLQNLSGQWHLDNKQYVEQKKMNTVNCFMGGAEATTSFVMHWNSACLYQCMAETDGDVADALQKCADALGGAWDGGDSGVLCVRVYICGAPAECDVSPVHMESTESDDSASYLIRIAYRMGGPAHYAALCAMVKYHYARSECGNKEDDERVAQLKWDLDWHVPPDSGPELYPGSLAAETDKVRDWLLNAADSCRCLHPDIRTDAARSLALACTVPDNRRLLLQSLQQYGGAEALMDGLLSAGTETEIRLCAASMLFECLRDSALSENLRGTLRTVGDHCVPLLQELQRVDAPLVDPRVGQCLELLTCC